MISFITGLMLAVNLLISDSVVQKIQYSSTAADLRTGRFIYKEQHEELFKDDRILKSTTMYISPSGMKISERVMNFYDDLSKPDYSLIDTRTGYLESAKTRTAGVILATTRSSYSSQLQEKILYVPQPYVIDGGLTYYFRANWDRLLAGATIEFNFIAPAKLDYFAFTASKDAIVTINGRKGMKIKLAIASMFLKPFVDPVYITYDLETKNILEYKGISNINDENGKSYIVSISFSERIK